MTEELTEVPPDATVVHPPHGFVKLIAQRGNDLDVVNCARVSFNKRSEWEYTAPDGKEFTDYDEAWEYVDKAWPFDADVDVGDKLSDKDAGLINFLMKGKHGTPFEQNFFQFHIRAPIFVFREWHRHRVGISINEESGRYVQLAGDFYLPDNEHVRVQEGKPGHYIYVSKGAEPMPPVHPGDKTAAYGDVVRRQLALSYEESYSTYVTLMSIGIAKEIARACLPVGIYSQMYWSCNARSLMNFLTLRAHEKALREIRDYAEAMEVMFRDAMPVTHAAFIANGRIAP